MTTDRQLLRMVLPPLLALGMVTALTHPLDAVRDEPAVSTTVPPPGAPPGVGGPSGIDVPPTLDPGHDAYVERRPSTSAVPRRRRAGP